MHRGETFSNVLDVPHRQNKQTKTQRHKDKSPQTQKLTRTGRHSQAELGGWANRQNAQSSDAVLFVCACIDGVRGQWVLAIAHEKSVSACSAIMPKTAPRPIFSAKAILVWSLPPFVLAHTLIWFGRICLRTVHIALLLTLVCFNPSCLRTVHVALALTLVRFNHSCLRTVHVAKSLFLVCICFSYVKVPAVPVVRERHRRTQGTNNAKIGNRT